MRNFHSTSNTLLLTMTHPPHHGITTQMPNTPLNSPFTLRAQGTQNSKKHSNPNLERSFGVDILLRDLCCAQRNPFNQKTAVHPNGLLGGVVSRYIDRRDCWDISRLFGWFTFALIFRLGNWYFKHVGFTKEKSGASRVCNPLLHCTFLVYALCNHHGVPITYYRLTHAASLTESTSHIILPWNFYELTVNCSNARAIKPMHLLL